MDTQHEEEKSSAWKALLLAWELGYSIAIPIVVFALVGRLLDHWLNTSPIFLLVGIVIAIVTTTLWLTQKAKRMLADIEREEKQTLNKPPQQ